MVLTSNSPARAARNNASGAFSCWRRVGRNAAAARFGIYDIVCQQEDLEQIAPRRTPAFFRHYAFKEG